MVRGILLVFFTSLLFAIITFCNGFATNKDIKPYGLNLRCKIKPERRDDFISVIKDTQRETLELEPASLQYVLGEDTDDENTFYIHQQYLGEEGLAAHCESEGTANWNEFKRTDPFVEGGEPTIEYFYTNLKPSKTAIRSAYCVHVELCIKEEFIDEFLQVIENNSNGSNNDEPLCLQYVYGESTTEPNKFIFHEEYKGEDGGKEGFDEHASAPHFKVWEEFAEKGPFTKDPVVHFFKSLTDE